MDLNELNKVTFDHARADLDQACGCRKEELTRLVDKALTQKECVTRGLEAIYNDDTSGLATRLAAVFLYGHVRGSMKFESQEMKAMVEFLTKIVDETEDA